MDGSTSEAQQWLNKRYSKVKDGRYFAHQPIYGFDTENSEPNMIIRLARTYHLLKIFNTLSFGNFVDIGGGEGYIAALVRNIFNVPANSVDLSTEASYQAQAIFNIQSLAADSAMLPLPDKSFDLVLCSEVIEHLSSPGIAMSELKRIARKYVVISTEEFSPMGELERKLRVCQLDVDYPHAERNWFTRRDFQTLYGDEAVFSSQMLNLSGRAREYISKKKLDKDQVKNAIDFLTNSCPLDVNHDGVIVIVPISGEKLVLNGNEEDIRNNPFKEKVFRYILEPYYDWNYNNSSSVQSELLLSDRLICIECKGSMELISEGVRCTLCGSSYPVIKGIPVIIQDSKRLNTASTEKRISDAIQNLSEGNVDREQKIKKLFMHLHGKRPICKNPTKQKIAFQILRILWFIGRPESVKSKVNRVFRKFDKSPPKDFELIEQLISAQ